MKLVLRAAAHVHCVYVCCSHACTVQYNACSVLALSTPLSLRHICNSAVGVRTKMTRTRRAPPANDDFIVPGAKQQRAAATQEASQQPPAQAAVAPSSMPPPMHLGEFKTDSIVAFQPSANVLPVVAGGPPFVPGPRWKPEELDALLQCLNEAVGTLRSPYRLPVAGAGPTQPSRVIAMRVSPLSP